MLTQNGLRPIVDDEDEQAIAALSPEDRAALIAWADEWDEEQAEWRRKRAATQRMLALCLPTAAASVAVLKVWGL